MIRAPGGQLITRVKTEAAAGKLAADLVLHSDRGLMKAIEQPVRRTTRRRTPPTICPRRWSRRSSGRTSRPAGAIAYHTELMKNPPKTWMDLHQARIRQRADRPGDRAVGRHDLDPHHVRAAGARRGLLGEAGRDQAAALSLRRAALRRAGARRVLDRAADLQHHLSRSSATARRSKTFFPPEGVPIVPYASGIPKTAQNPNAARLYLDWQLSEEGQIYSIKQHGNITSLKVPPLLPAGLTKDHQGVGAEFRAVRVAVREVDRGMEQNLTGTGNEHVAPPFSPQCRRARSPAACRARRPSSARPS